MISRDWCPITVNVRTLDGSLPVDQNKIYRGIYAHRYKKILNYLLHYPHKITLFLYDPRIESSLWAMARASRDLDMTPPPLPHSPTLKPHKRILAADLDIELTPS